MALIRIEWVKVEGIQYAVARWRASGELINELIDYAIYLSREASVSALTLEAALYNLSPFFVFLKKNKIHINDANDVWLVKYRDESFRFLRGNALPASSDKTQKRTINERIKGVYRFAFWYQSSHPLNFRLIGPSGCNIRSELSVSNLNARSKAGVYSMFPLLYKLTGGRSKHKPVSRATNSIKSGLIRRFSSHYDEYIMARNILIIDIADEMGLRRASLNSLECSDFTDWLAAENVGNLVIIPKSQKFGYRISYKFSFSLIMKICNFIEGPRKRLFHRLGISEHIGQNRIFISSKSCRPLNNQSITDIIAKSMREIGVKHGSIHAFRHKFINDEVEREINRRLLLKLDTSIESIAAAVALKVGHANTSSLFTYISDALQRLEALPPDTQTIEIERLRNENTILKNQIKTLGIRGK